VLKQHERTGESFWRKADECKRAATLANDERLRLMYSDLAEQWEASASEGAAAANAAHAFNRTRWSLPGNRASDLF
jgi:hypothetical protein